MKSVLFVNSSRSSVIPESRKTLPAQLILLASAIPDHRASIVDPVVLGDETEKALLRSAREADLVCFSSYVFTAERDTALMRLVSKVNPNIVAGGWGPTEKPSAYVKNTPAKTVLLGTIGQAIGSLRDLLEDKPREKIPGICFSEKNRVFYTAPRLPEKPPLIVSPSAYGLRLRDYVFSEKLNKTYLPLLVRVRGCAYSWGQGCKYCNIHRDLLELRKHGDKYYQQCFKISTFLDEKRVKNDYETYLDWFDAERVVPELTFLDDAMPYSVFDWTFRVLDGFGRLIQTRPGFPRSLLDKARPSLRLLLRPDEVTPEYVERLAKLSRSLDVTVDLGADTFCAREAKLMRRGLSPEKTMRAVSLLAEKNIYVEIFAILKLTDEWRNMAENLEGVLSAAAKENVSVEAIPWLFTSYTLLEEKGREKEIPGLGIRVPVFWSFNKMNDSELSKTTKGLKEYLDRINTLRLFGENKNKIRRGVETLLKEAVREKRLRGNYKKTKKPN